jgi:nicotinate-nucleotide--dimethylbenzimidazole phosphoribosyltransferase
MMSPTVRSAIQQIPRTLDHAHMESLSSRWRSLPKEPGGLGPVESAALHYCLLRRCQPGAIERKALYVFCAGHSFAGEDRAASLPPAQRFAALLAGDSPAAALASLTHAALVPVNAALAGVSAEGAIDLRLADSSGDPLAGPAMTVPLVNEALEAGIVLADDASKRYEAVGIACLDGRVNPSASAVASALLGSAPDQWLFNEPSIAPLQASRRRDAVREALARHAPGFAIPFDVLRLVGSVDIAVMTGFLLGAALTALPVMIDGFASSVAALLARRLAPDSFGVCIFSHANPSPAHPALLSLLAVTPVLGHGISQEGGYAALLALHHLDLALRILGCLGNRSTLK